MAAPRQGLPVRLERAPHRGAAFALSNASKRARIRSIGSRSRGSLFIGSRSRGSLFIFRSSPPRSRTSTPLDGKSVTFRSWSVLRLESDFHYPPQLAFAFFGQPHP